MRFSDGMKFDLSGECRIVRRSDGLYVVGRGTLTPIDSYSEGIQIIAETTSRITRKGETPHAKDTA